MASMYDTKYTNMSFYNWAQQYPDLYLAPYSITNQSSSWRIPMSMPATPNTPQMSPVPSGFYDAPAEESVPTDLTQYMLTPEVQKSVADYYKNLGKQTTEASKYFEKANVANKIAAGAQIVQGVSSLFGTYNSRSTVRLTNQELDKQIELIDLNITNQEALATKNFKNSIADLQVISAAKNVDIRSQALRSDIVQGGEDLGKDLADLRLQGSLQKKAIKFQKTLNNLQQKKNEQQAWINFGANLMSAGSYLI